MNSYDGGIKMEIYIDVLILERHNKYEKVR